MLELDALKRPGYYREQIIQDGLKMFWPLIFPAYALWTYKDVKGMSRWFPDLVGVNEDNGNMPIIVAEVKRPGNGRPPTIAQVCGYVSEFHDVYPSCLVYPVIFGPWNQDGMVEIRQGDGYEVGMIQLQQLGRHIESFAGVFLRRFERIMGQLIDFDLMRLPSSARSILAPDLLLWFLSCPIKMNCAGKQVIPIDITSLPGPFRRSDT